MMQTSQDSLGAYVLALIVVGICCRIAWRISGATMEGMSAYGMLDVHLVCMLARRSRSY